MPDDGHRTHKRTEIRPRTRQVLQKSPDRRPDRRGRVCARGLDTGRSLPVGTPPSDTRPQGRPGNSVCRPPRSHRAPIPGPTAASPFPTATESAPRSSPTAVGRTARSAGYRIRTVGRRKAARTDEASDDQRIAPDRASSACSTKESDAPGTTTIPPASPTRGAKSGRLELVRGS